MIRKAGGARRQKTNRQPLLAGLPAAPTLVAREAAVLAGEQAGDQRQSAADRRQKKADRRDVAADLRDEAAELREQLASLRDQAMRDQSVAVSVQAALSALSDAQLREVNERLVIATLRAQTMAETAADAIARMTHMAEHDVLTGLPNRSLLSDRLAQAILLARRHRNKVALMYLDLDHFKHINDTLGHAVGDQLLQSAAHRLQAAVRHSDTVSRQGGDEFVILLAEVESAQDAVNTAEKVIRSMAEPHLIGNHRLHVTLSIGISLYPEDGDDAETLLSNADTAMYYAKRNGRNNYERFVTDMNARAVERQSVEAALRHGLESNDFVLHYQPKVNIASGAITGAEALVRLQRDNDCLLGPNDFISVAENCGLILPLGQWVLREACRQMAAWRAAGLAIRQIAVNVSAVEFRGKDFLAGVQAVLDETGLPPQCLELELTESGLMQDTEITLEVLRALKKLGVQIAIDDFGTGYSSLNYLRRFQIDTLKIDQSFVQDISGDADAGEAIVGAVIAMGMSLKQRVVAEGVETLEQLAYLQARHCAEGQGFLFSQPVAAEEFALLVQTQQH